MKPLQVSKEKDKIFTFSAENLKLAAKIMARYPEGRQRSAVLPLLDLAQRQNGGWVSPQVITYVAEFLDMAPIRVQEIASFYSMFNLHPVGKNFVQICRTTPCWLRGSDELVERCRKDLGVGLGETTEDEQFTVVEVECLGACVNAPVVQINDDYYEDLTPDSLGKILAELKQGKKAKNGSQIGREGSAPEGGRMTLIDGAPKQIKTKNKK